MSDTAVQGTSPSTWVPTLRVGASVVGAVLVLGEALPPAWGWAQHSEWAQTLQFVIWGFVGPSLLAIGAPGRLLGLSHSSGQAGSLPAEGERRILDRWAARQRIDRDQSRLIMSAIALIVVSVLWRTAPAVNALVRHPALMVLEAITLLVCGWLFEVQIVESPPLRPCHSHPYRIGATAAVMWSAWVVAYLAGMSHSQWYGAFTHVAGHGLSAVADQEIAAAIVWGLTAATFIPVVFWNLFRWLGSEEDPNVAMLKLVREEKEQGFFGSRG